MFDLIETIQPYVVVIGVACWEIFVGWCLRESIRADLPAGQRQPVSCPAEVHRAPGSSDLPARSRTTHIAATSA